MNEVQNFANFHTCYLPYGLKFFHKGHPKHKLNYSWPNLCQNLDVLGEYQLSINAGNDDDVFSKRLVVLKGVEGINIWSSVGNVMGLNQSTQLIVKILEGSRVTLKIDVEEKTEKILLLDGYHTYYTNHT